MRRMAEANGTERKQRMDTSSQMEQVLSRDNLNEKDLGRATAYSRKNYARIFGGYALHFGITKERLTRFGLVSMLDYYTKVKS